MNERTCKTCVWSKVHKEVVVPGLSMATYDFLKCHFNPPIGSGFPKVEDSDFCKEHSPNYNPEATS